MKLRDLALVVRSKNAGPYLFTFDIILPDHKTFELVRRSGCLSGATIAALYGRAEDTVSFIEYPPGNAFKATFARPIPSGDIGDTDVYGAQQHAPLLDIEVTPAPETGIRGVSD